MSCDVNVMSCLPLPNYFANNSLVYQCLFCCSQWRETSDLFLNSFVTLSNTLNTLWIRPHKTHHRNHPQQQSPAAFSSVDVKLVNIFAFRLHLHRLLLFFSSYCNDHDLISSSFVFSPKMGCAIIIVVWDASFVFLGKQMTIKQTIYALDSQFLALLSIDSFFVIS